MRNYLFSNRQEAGKRLAEALRAYAGRADVLILALPRGGVPVAFEVSQELSLPLDILLVRKLGVPWHEELAMGAIAEHNVIILNDEIIDQCGISKEVIADAVAREEKELLRRNRQYRGERKPLPISGKTVVIVDDGLATGATMRAAVSALRTVGAAAIIIAVPVGAALTCQELLQEADKVICLYTPEPFSSVGGWYRDFSQTSDEEVQRIMAHLPG